MFLLNSRLGLFSAALFREHPFSLSYGVNLPSSLTTLLPLALEFSSCLPVSVCGTGSWDIRKAFLVFVHDDFPTIISVPFDRVNQRPASSLSKRPFALILRRLRIFNRMCIGYAFPPHLSSRLTRSGRTFLLKPQTFGHYDSHIILATHSGILTRIQSTAASAATSPRIRRSPTPLEVRNQM